MRTGGNNDLEGNGCEDCECGCCAWGIAGETMDECQADGEYLFRW
jgi:hypothetical protein